MNKQKTEQASWFQGGSGEANKQASKQATKRVIWSEGGSDGSRDGMESRQAKEGGAEILSRIELRSNIATISKLL